MGTIEINGKRFVGSNVSIENGKLIIDGKGHEVDLSGNIAVQVFETASGSKCAASVTCKAPGEIVVRATAGENVAKSMQMEHSAAAWARATSDVRAVAVASVHHRQSENKKR